MSVLILTRNEEMNIAECLRTLEFSDDVVVLDSFSTDRTVEIARQFPNVRVVQRTFDTEYVQRNFGLHEVEWKNEWVYVCDADERVPAELAAEIAGVVAAGASMEGEPAAYRLRYRNMFMGRWIRHCSGADVWLYRLVKPARVRYEARQTNVHPIIDGPVGELKGRFVHYSFNAGLVRWFRKHNYYSDREAMEGCRVVETGGASLRSLRSRDPVARRRALKNLSFFLPCRWAWRFANDFFLRRGFRDGRSGGLYCSMVAMYEYWIELKMKEQRRSWRDRNEALVAKLLDGDYGPVPMLDEPQAGRTAAA